MDEGDRPRSDDELPEETEPSIDGETKTTESGERDDGKAGEKADENNDSRSETETTESNQTDESESNQTDESERDAVSDSTDETNVVDDETGSEVDPSIKSTGGLPTGEDTETEDKPSQFGGERSTEKPAEPRPIPNGRNEADIPNGQNEADDDQSVLYRFRHDREGALMWLREMLSSVAIVLVIGLILFGVSGVWPPMVAVESGSMEPNMEVGDLVFVTEPGRLAPDAADNDVGVVTHEVGETVDYRTFGSYGSVVIYRPPGRTASPIIHRAMFHVEEGEDWYDRTDDEYHNAGSCDELRNCPAPHDGYITLGDNNGVYDQARGLSAPVRAEWVTGVARVRIPYLGYVRLIATGQAEPGDVIDAALGAITAGSGISGSVSGGTASLAIGGVTTNGDSF